MRDELRRAFDEITEAPHPALASSLRARLMAGPASPGPRPWRLAAMGTALAVIAIVAVSGLYLMTPRGGSTPAPAGGGSPTPAASANPASSPSPSPAYSPSPGPSEVPANLPAFACATFSGGGAAAGAPQVVSNVTDVRVGTGSGYDRLVIEFDGQVPSYMVTPQASSSFRMDASGQVVQLLGGSGVKIVVRGASGHDLNGKPTFTGSQDLKPGYPVLREARQLGDFERVFSWGLGLSKPNCIRAFTLTGPDRLVIDIESP